MVPAGADSATSPVAGIAQAPGQPEAAPNAVPPVPQQKKSTTKKPSPGPFGTDIFRFLVSGY
jgi:hypothetical protein